MNDYSALPVDPESQANLAAAGLDLELIDTSDEANDEATRRWLLSDSRGFHDSMPSPESLDTQVDTLRVDRVVGVWDRSGAEPETPVATVRCGEMGLTLPGGAALPAWAISSVTVTSTHRRRGIARALLTAELRTAVLLGLPMAMLTVSEATIYGRYGFGPAAYQSLYSIDTTRARWTGPVPAGRVQFVSPESLLVDGPPVFERARLRSPGEVDRRDIIWRHILGLVPTDPGAEKRDLRTVRYDDENGTPQGFAVYRIVLDNHEFPGRLELRDLVTATDGAYAALWRFLVEMDLVKEVVASMRSITEPVIWQLADRRALHKTDQRDHLWLRILDLPTVLERRTWSAPGDYRLDVTDELGFAGGEFLLSIDDHGVGTVRPLTGPAPAGAAHLALSIADLSAVCLGGSSAVELAHAGRITERTTDAAARADAAFRSADVPRLSTWF